MGAPQGTVCGRTHVCGHHGTGAPGEKCQLRTAGSEDLLRSIQIVKYVSEVSDGGSYRPRKTMIALQRGVTTVRSLCAITKGSPR